jgi:hypothetical protein
MKSVLSLDTPVDEMHERAILTGASIHFDDDFPAATSHKRREIQVVRRLWNGSTKPYSLLLY